MAKITFMKWIVAKEQRRPISVEPSRVDVIEHYQDATAAADADKYKMQIAMWWGEDGHDHIPAATKIIMQGKQEYIVQGTVEDVTKAINGAKNAQV